MFTRFGWLVSTFVFASLLPHLGSADQLSPFCLLPSDSANPWLPVTPAPNETQIPAPRPASDCQLYRPAWQRFMVATQPVGGAPSFLGYPSFETLFNPPATRSNASAPQRMLILAPRNIQRPNDPNQSLQTLMDKNQAGIGGTVGGDLIDQNGRFVYYAIHVNPAFAQFLRDHQLMTVDAIRNVDENLTFLGDDPQIATGANTNVEEFKSAWMVVDPQHPPSNYFVVPAELPHLVVQGDTLVQAINNGKPVFDNVNVALLALHVVFTLPGHPEMIWSTFEHVHLRPDGVAIRDNAPPASDNPSANPPPTIAAESNFAYPLYKASTPIKQANQPLQLKDIVQSWDESKQSFSNGGSIVQTSVYRPYPGSKTDGSTANPGHGEDDEVIGINQQATDMFRDAISKGVMTDADKRQNYRLVGATWLDQPVSGSDPSFKIGQSFVINGNQSTDDPGQPIAGEGRLGSTAMESFTEFEDGAPNCFSCHDTNAVKHNGVLIHKARLNVSHVLSKYGDSQLHPTQ
jgi:hypothetical protein